MNFVVTELYLEGSSRYGGLEGVQIWNVWRSGDMEVMQAWSGRGLEAWRYGGREVWRCGGRVGMEVLGACKHAGRET
jgi:hypothetical protein